MLQEKLFLEKGFNLTSTTDIAKETGCNQSQINYYFRTKEKLFITIFEKKFLLFFNSIGEGFVGDLSFTEKISLLAERHFDMLQKNPLLPKLLIQEISLHPDRISQVTGTVFNNIQGFLTQLATELETEVAAGRIRQIEITDIIQTIVALNIGVFLTRPIFKEMMNLSDSQMDELLLQRRKENVLILLGSLTPGDVQ